MKKTILFLCGMLLFNVALAQESSVKGVVQDNFGAPLPGVNVLLKGTNNGTVTDFDGAYQIEVTDLSSAILMFSSIGYSSEEIPVGGRSEINVVLQEDAESLEEVVVIGYGSVRKKDLTGSVSSVKSEDLVAFPTVSVTEALQGRAAGVEITASEGASPGSQPKIRIRGATSLNASNDPLFVVDGFAGGNLPAPEDIKSMEILKDASATAIYGSRGANGVVIVTTKRGISAAPKVSINLSASTQKIANTVDVLSGPQLGAMLNDAHINSGGDANSLPYPSASSLPNYDHLDMLLRDGTLLNGHVSVTGGGEKVRYYISGKIYDQKGIVNKSDYNRKSVVVNVDTDVTDKLNLGANVLLGTENTNWSGSTDRVMAWSLKYPSFQNYINNDGSYTVSEIGDEVNSGVAIADARVRNRVDDDMQAILKASYTFSEKFKLNFQVGNTIVNTRNGNYEPTTLLDGNNAGGIASMSSFRQDNLSTETFLTYTNSWDDGFKKLTIMGGHSFQTNERGSFSAGNNNFITDSSLYWNLGSGSVYAQPSSWTDKWDLESYFARANFDLNGKFMFTLTGRYDGSSRFGQNNKWAFFPSGAVSWNITNHDFMPKDGVINNLKARVSYGLTGNTGIGTYASLAELTTIFSVQNGGIVNGVVQKDVANSDLTWESTAQFNIGVDLGLLDDRIRFTMDYYNMVTEDLLYTVPLPEYSGYRSSLQNIGSITNKGFEFAIGADIIKKDNFSWDADFNMSFNDNRITELAGGDLYVDNTPSRLNAGVTNILREGETVGAFFGYIYDGIYGTDDAAEGTPGTVRYKDISGPDGVPDGVIDDDDRTIIGDGTPDFIFGFNNTFRLNNWDLNIFFNGSAGNDIYNFTKLELEKGLSGSGNSYADAVNRWTPTNQDTDVPMASYNLPAIKSSTRYVEDGSYVRLRNIALGYTFDFKEESNLDLRLFASAQNLFTITNYSGFDPEVSNHASSIFRGMDYGAYPMTQSFTLGVNFSF